ncbi:GT4 family glycosyltransferase [Limnoglobus roseus]|uniref:GT4 family glycosyltransferase n=1 Tax=Limnoglobus roseus TaxID=2598579 RepID=A0A5C1ABG8_9BACT|nr:GT4 family glycosyltransferase [Limnoglobus roseus]
MGGSGQYFWEIVRRMPEDRIVVMTDSIDGGDVFDATHPVPTVRLPMAFAETGGLSRRGFLEYWRFARKVREVCDRHEIDFIWCGRCVPEGWVAWQVNRLTGLPYLVSAHGEEVTLPVAGGQSGVMTSRQHRWMARQVFKRAAGVVANSDNTRRILRSDWAVPGGRLHRLTPGVDSDFFRPVDPCPATRYRLGWTNRRVLVTVGRLHARKGHGLMLAALRRVREEVPNVLYAIVGDGPERENLARQVADLRLQNHVQFFGEAERAMMLQIYQQADAFVLPNRQVGTEIEGFGMVLLEAQACGKPVIAGASGGTAETLRQFETGLLVDATDTDALASAACLLLLNPQLSERMGRAARAWALQQFKWTALVEQFGGLVANMPD